MISILSSRWLGPLTFERTRLRVQRMKMLVGEKTAGHNGHPKT